MKKLLILLLALVMCVAVFTACGPQGDNSNGTTTAPTTTAPSTSVPNSTAPSNPTSPDLPSEEEIITVAEALELCGEPGNITEERYYIRGIVDAITNPSYGEMTISDETGSIYVYGTYSHDGEATFAEIEDKPYRGDEVILSCILQNYDGTKEVKNARLISVKHNEPDVDESQYTEMTIDEARKAEKDTLVKVTGVVAQITYADKKVPNGIYLADGTNSILIHDGDLAQRVQVGNKITVLGTKTYWILGTEQGFADKFGYKGSCQLESAVLLDNDGRTDNAYDRSWIQETTIKELMDTPLSENITTSIFKVNALVSKVEGTGFTNYYFNDLDGKTGSYTYTQNSGADFTWLDQFDGKICTVYLSIINAKSTNSGCVYRFLPIQVIDESFKFDTKDTAEHIVKYYGVDQFMSLYTGDPCLEVLTSVSSDLLGFKDAKLSYSSDNISVVNFKEADGKLYMRGIMPGTANITITGSYDGKTYSETLQITIGGAVTVDFVTVKDAIDAADGEKVTVKGIVGPSLVNKTGFYLIDDTGVISVTLDSEQMKTLRLGHEIILEGTRQSQTKDSSVVHGQSVLAEAQIITNNYGSHDYSTASFVTGKTLADLAALSVLEDHTTTVFVLKCTVVLEVTPYYTRLVIKDGSTSVNLYSANANQYKFLHQFDGQEITVEIAPCNWNDKKSYPACILSVITEDGKLFNELNFEN